MHSRPQSERFGSRSLALLILAIGAAGAGCAGGKSGPTGTGGATGMGGGSATGGSTGAGGTSSTGGAIGSGGTTGSGGSVATGGTTGSGGSVATGGTTGTGGAQGTGGTPATGGSTGTGGTSATGGATGSGGAGGGASSGPCPSNATFCASFEETSGPPMSSPLGMAAIEDPDEYGIAFGDSTGAFTLDKTGAFDGAQSFKVMSPGAFHYRMLGVSVPQTFWVRLHIKSDQAIGQEGHNAFFIAMTDPNYHNSTHSVEVSEQFGCIILNDHDALFPTGTTCGANGALSANAWHCMEAMFDGTTGNVQVYADGTQIINATAWANAKAAFNTFELGYADYHDLAGNPAPPTNVWYDDVAIAPTRIGCP